MFQMTDKKAKAVADLALLSVIGLGVVVLFVGASTLPPPRFEPLGSAAMPRILGVILVFLGIPVAFAAVRDLMSPEASTPKSELKLPFVGIAVFAALIAYVAALDFGQLPFVPTTTVFVALVGMAIDNVSLRILTIYGGLGLVLSSVLSYVFSNFLYVQIG